MKKVIIEMRATPELQPESLTSAEMFQTSALNLDQTYQPVPLSAPAAADMQAEAAVSENVYLVRGEIEESKEEEVKALPNVINVWTDARIEAFDDDFEQESETALLEPDEPLPAGSGEARLEAMDLSLATQCSPIDCQSTVPKGTIADVAGYLKCNRLWNNGIRGQGVVVGVCDSGVNKGRVPNCIGGWSPVPNYTPGTAPVTSHGTMCAFDVVGMAPDAKILDIAILQSAGGFSGLLSDAISAFHWALTQFQSNGTPQILTNSWGMFQEAWAPDYTTNPNHPFTRKVVEVINKGMLVTFAAGNCGSQCPSSRCGSDTGPGKSIWGANGHPDVITVGAANIKEEWIGYTSQGPGALDPKKPDFCAPSHFTGNTNSDNGTSAACPVCAGVIALYKSHDPKVKQEQVKKALKDTARNLCAPGWDRNSGFGMIQAESAFNKLFYNYTNLAHAMWTHGTSVHPEKHDNIVKEYKRGMYSVYEVKAESKEWFHFAIPTPVIVDRRRLRLDSVMLNFNASKGVYVTAIHIYDADNKIKEYNGLSLTGDNPFLRFDVLNNYVRQGIGVSLQVVFKNSESRRNLIAFRSAGGDFIN